jgi:hypothetical protein
MKIEARDVIAYRIGSELVCIQCAEAEEVDELTLDNIFTVDDRDGSDNLFFCDRCKELI